jgi:hypothetical protein
MMIQSCSGWKQAKTLQDRIRHINNFKKFVGKETAGSSLGELLADGEGKKRQDFLVGKFFQHNDCDCWCL